MFSNILLPVNGSPLSDRVAEQVIRLAREWGARITALTASLPHELFTGDDGVMIDDEESYIKAQKDLGARWLVPIGRAADAAGVKVDAVHVFHAKPHLAILETAEARGCDVICMGSSARNELFALLFGDSAVRVLVHSHIPLLVLRGEGISSD
jgi:nucleotide-binding universal stress UspA family protein